MCSSVRVRYNGICRLAKGEHGYVSPERDKIAPKDANGWGIQERSTWIFIMLFQLFHEFDILQNKNLRLCDLEEMARSAQKGGQVPGRVRGVVFQPVAVGSWTP